MAYKIRAILEIAGFPEEHVKEVLKKVLEGLKKEPNLKVTKEETEQPKKIKEHIWSAFTELEIEFENMHALNNFCFEYMPSSVEILDTKDISFKSSEYNAMINDTLAKIHELNFQLNNLNATLRAMKTQKPNLS